MSLTEQLNKGFRLPFQEYTGSIPKNVPALREDGRIFAGGDTIFQERLNALTPNEKGKTDQEKIDGWGQYFDLADLCLTFENFVMLQKNSGFLTGIRGVVEKDKQTYVAIDAEAVKAVITAKGEKYFQKQLSPSEIVHYQLRDGTAKQKEAKNIILLPYNGTSLEFNADQFKAIKGKTLKRESLISGRDLAPEEIVNKGQVVHPAWGIYGAETIVPLVQRQKQFRFENRDYQFDTLMGFYLPRMSSKNQAEGRALCVDRLDGRSWLCGYVDLGRGDSRVVGVDRKYAAGVAKK